MIATHLYDMEGGAEAIRNLAQTSKTVRSQVEHLSPDPYFSQLLNRISQLTAASHAQYHAVVRDTLIPVNWRDDQLLILAIELLKKLNTSDKPYNILERINKIIERIKDPAIKADAMIALLATTGRIPDQNDSFIRRVWADHPEAINQHISARSLIFNEALKFCEAATDPTALRRVTMVLTAEIGGVPKSERGQAKSRLNNITKDLGASLIQSAVIEAARVAINTAMPSVGQDSRDSGT